MIKHCICHQTLIPVRNNASESSEMVTQLLFGELYKLLDLQGKWARIVSCYDNYEGWMDAKLLQFISEQNYVQMQKAESFIVKTAIAKLTFLDDESTMPLVAGSNLYNVSKDGKGVFLGRPFEFGMAGDIDMLNEETVLSFVKDFLNAPYLWGGRTILGIDCSGLTQVAFKLIGVKLARDASKQVLQGAEVAFLGDAKAGDLAFFANEDGKIIHVGILLTSNKIIHASGWVRIDKVDDNGIFNLEANNYSHKLKVIKRLL